MYDRNFLLYICIYIFRLLKTYSVTYSKIKRGFMKSKLTKKEKLRDEIIALKEQVKEMMKVWQSMDEEGWEVRKSA